MTAVTPRPADGKGIGARLLRKEDARFLAGRGQFVGDLTMPGRLDVAFVRSPVAHARIKRIDIPFDCGDSVFTADHLAGAVRPVRTPSSIPGYKAHDYPALAIGKVRMVGEPVAMCIAPTRAEAEDLCERIAVEYEPLPPLTDSLAARKPGAALVHDEFGDNLFLTTVSDTRFEESAREAAIVVRREFKLARQCMAPLEGKGAFAYWDDRAEQLVLYSSTQAPHIIRTAVSEALGIEEGLLRVVAPDVGGGFGGKGHVYPEDVLVPYLARKLRRPVKYVEDRFEHLVNSAHARDNFHELEIGFDDDGKIICIVDDFVIDSGAYSPVGATCAANSIAHLLGPYDIQNYEAKGTLVATNKTSNAPYRGAGRPEAAFAMERAIDIAAHSIGLDPIQMRLRNMVPPERLPFSVGLPYRDGVPITYDSGDYPQALRRAVEELGGLENFRRRQADALKAGRYLGIGVGCYVEGTGVGPFEGASVRLDPSGKVMVAVGANNHGQGHETVFAQVAADVWNVPIDQVVVTTADTASVPMGYGTIASRSTVTAGSAVVHASAKVKDKVLAIAANMLETPTADLEFRDGAVGVKGVPDLKVTLKEIWWASRPGWDHKRPPDVEAGLEANHYYEPPTVTWSYATNAAIVELDPDTGRVTIEKFVAVHDAGILVNPLLADGQVRGGLVQGIGAALYEEIAYDENGQILMGTLADYLLPTADDTPPITVIHQEIPSPSNPLGVKGLGEGGAIAPPCAITNAVSDALRPFKAEFNATPVRWEQVRKVFAEAGVSTRRTPG